MEDNIMPLEPSGTAQDQSQLQGDQIANQGLQEPVMGSQSPVEGIQDPTKPPVQTMTPEQRKAAMDAEVSLVKREQFKDAVNKTESLLTKPQDQTILNKADEIIGDIGKGIVQGGEGFIRTSANTANKYLFFGKLNQVLRDANILRGQLDPYGNFSTDREDFAELYKTDSTLGSIVSEISQGAFTAASMSKAGSLMQGVEGLGAAGSVIRGTGKVLAPFEGSTSKAANLAKWFHENGLQNVLQAIGETRTDAVPDIQSLAKMLGIENDIPEALKNGDLNSLEGKIKQGLSQYVAGGSLGVAGNTVLGGITKAVLGTFGKHMDETVRIYGSKIPRTVNGELIPVPINASEINYDKMIEEGLDDMMSGPLKMSTPDFSDPAFGTLPAARLEANPELIVNQTIKYDEDAVAAAKLRLKRPEGEDLNPNSLIQNINKVEEATKHLKEEALKDAELVKNGKLTPEQQAARAKIRQFSLSAVRNNLGIDLETLVKDTEDLTSGPRIHRDAVLVFMDAFNKNFEAAFNDVNTIGRTETSANLLKQLNELNLPPFIVNNMDDAVVGPVVIKSLYDTFETAFKTMSKTELEVIRNSLNDYDSIRNLEALPGNPTAQLTSNLTNQTHQSFEPGITPENRILNATLTKDTLLQIVRSLQNVDVSTLNDSDVVRVGHSIFRSFYGLMVSRNTLGVTSDVALSNLGLSSNVGQHMLIEPKKELDRLLSGQWKDPKQLDQINKIMTEAKANAPADELKIPGVETTYQGIDEEDKRFFHPFINENNKIELTDGTENVGEILTKMSGTLGEVILRQGRAGIFNPEDLKNIQYITSGKITKNLDPVVSEYLSSLFNMEQRVALTRLQSTLELMRDPSNIGPGLTKEQVAMLESELTDQLKGLSTQANPTNVLPVDKAQFGLNTPTALAILDGLGGLRSKSLIMFSAANVLKANVINTTIDSLGGLLRGLPALGDNASPESKIALYRFFTSFKESLWRSTRDGRLGAAKEAFMSGKSTLFRDSADLADQLNSVRDLKGVSFGMQDLGAGIQDYGPRSINFIDELTKQGLYQTELRAALMSKVLQNEPSLGFKEARKQADNLYETFFYGLKAKTETQIYKDAQRTIDATGKFNKNTDPISYAAAIELQRLANLEQMHKDLKLNEPAPEWVANTTNDIKQYLDYVAGNIASPGTTMKGLSGILQGGENPLSRAVMKFVYPFASTTVNEIVRAIDFTLSPAVGAVAYAKGGKFNSPESVLQTVRELSSNNPAISSRAHGRVLIASALVLGAIYRHATKEEVDTTSKALDLGDTSLIEGETNVPIVSLPSKVDSNTADKSARILDKDPVEILNQPVPTLGTAYGVYDLISRAVVNASQAVLEDGVTGDNTAFQYVAEIAYLLGGKDVVEPLKNAVNNPLAIPNDAAARSIATLFGGTGFLGLLADLKSDVKLRTPGSDLRTFNYEGNKEWFPTWSLMTLKGRSNDSRTNLVGQKQSTTNKINVILEDVLKIKMPAELKLREGLTKDANKTLVNILAAKGYPVPALDFRMKDPSGSGKSLDLRTIMFPDGKSAFVHLNEIFAYGHNDYPDSDKNLLGGYSNKTDISLNKYLLDGLDSLIGTKGNEVPDKGLIKTDVKDERSVALDNEIKRLLSERLAGAKEILMHQFNKQAIEKDTSIDKNLKKTDYWKNAWNKLATGDLR